MCNFPNSPVCSCHRNPRLLLPPPTHDATCCVHSTLRCVPVCVLPTQTGPLCDPQCIASAYIPVRLPRGRQPPPPCTGCPVTKAQRLWHSAHTYFIVKGCKQTSFATIVCLLTLHSWEGDLCHHTGSFTFYSTND